MLRFAVRRFHPSKISAAGSHRVLFHSSVRLFTSSRKFPQRPTQPVRGPDRKGGAALELTCTTSNPAWRVRILNKFFRHFSPARPSNVNSVVSLRDP